MNRSGSGCLRTAACQCFPSWAAEPWWADLGIMRIPSQNTHPAPEWRASPCTAHRAPTVPRSPCSYLQSDPADHLPADNRSKMLRRTHSIRQKTLSRPSCNIRVRSMSGASQSSNIRRASAAIFESFRGRGFSPSPSRTMTWKFRSETNLARMF